ncbi:MAG: 3-keto-5-aminohexanoate cleavage protein [Pyrinomonadaceae bacterium]
MSVLIKAAINGGRSRTEHEAIPVTPDEQAAAVVECAAVGANVIHLHIRSTSGDPSERESLQAADVARTLLAVRFASPKAQIGVSTGAWILPDVVARFEAVKVWEVLPDFVSVNFSEDGAVELAGLLLSRRVDVEAGLCDAATAEVFLKSGLATRCIRALIEPQEQELESALQTVNAIERVLRSGAVELPLLLHGTEATVWPMMDEAIARGYDVRVGLEDTLVLPDGRMARDNAELVMEAMRRVRAEKRA